MTTTMTRDEARAFLAAPRVAILSVPQPGRGPLASPVWYRVEANGDLAFITPEDTAKGRLIAVGTRLSLCVQKDTPSYQYVSVEGPVARIDAADWSADLIPMATRYLGATEGRAYADAMLAAFARTGRMLVRLRPERWLTADYSKRARGGG